MEHFGLFHQGVGWAGDAAQGGPADDRIKLRVRVGPPPWGATLVSSSFAELTVARPGAVVTGVFTLRNTGSSTWRPGEVLLATTAPRDRPSRLRHASWRSAARVATPEAAVPPGELWRVRVPLQIPRSARGLFDERFGLVREGVAWFGDDAQGGPDDDALFVRGFVVTSATPDPGTFGPAPWPHRPVPSPAAPDGGSEDAGPGLTPTGCQGSAGHRGWPGTEGAAWVVLVAVWAISHVRRRRVHAREAGGAARSCAR